MGFIIGLIVNGIMLSIPIGATLGTLFGIRPFENEREPIQKDLNAIVMTSLCDEFHEFAQNKNGLNYTLNSNEILKANDSTLCMTMTTFENSTYPSNTTAPIFSFVWDYPFEPANASSPANETKPLIHAFPQAQPTTGGILPITLEDLGELTLEFSWTMGIGDTISPATSIRRLGAQEVNATVALDMYLDADQDKAGNASAAAFEMIILFAKIGLEDPVGFGNGTIVLTEKLNGTEFNLFAGQNDNEQNVFSWVATDPVEEFYTDISPLFDFILTLNTVKGFDDLLVDIPTVDTFLGYVGFGTQAYNSIGNVTFAVPRLGMDIRPFDKLA